MDSGKFYDLAVDLSSVNSAAEQRSATSRAYYSAFHISCELLHSIGITLPKSDKCHEKVPWVLENSGDMDVKAAGIKLGSLRGDRNTADYKLSNHKAENQKNVALHIQSADEIIDCVGSCFAGKPKAATHAAMRSYAQNTLGWLLYN